MGRNMIAVRVDKDIVILDMGLRLDRVQIHEDVEINTIHSRDLIEMGAIPDDRVMKDVDGKVRAIVCTHGHLDHIGAIPKLAHRYDVPIIGTPYTAELIRHEIADERKFTVKNEVKAVGLGGVYQVTPEISVEFIGVQHSIVDAAYAAIHTPGGVVLYASDFKMDRTPVVGEPPDFGRLRELGQGGVKVMLTESTNATRPGKTPSERIARDLVRDVLLGTEEADTGVIVTTFSSHVARVKTLIEAAAEMERVPVLLGRSMDRYLTTARDAGYIEFPVDIEIYGKRYEIDRALKKVNRDKKGYLPIVTGHQGEPGAILTRIASGETPFKVESGDKIVFSANIIPNPLTRANRYSIETKLRMKGARIYPDVHVSGHASCEDHWELLRLVNPEQVIPCHGDLNMHSKYIEMAEETGYVFGDTAHILRNGEEMIIK